MGVTVRSYRIGGRDEECECGRCGYPLVADEEAYAVTVDGEYVGDAYCSKRCAGPALATMRLDLADGRRLEAMLAEATS